MSDFFQKIIEIDKIQVILEYIYQLNSTEINVLVIITSVLIAIMVFKWFGVKIFFVLLFVYLIIYVIYSNNLANEFVKREQEESEHIKMIENYLPDNEVIK